MGKVGDPGGGYQGPYWKGWGTKREGRGTEVGKWGYCGVSSPVARTAGKR